MTDTNIPHSATSSVPCEDVPIPPRFWWLKRISLAFGILLVGLIAVRVFWGYEAHRRLQAEIDKYVAAGEPIYPEDFDQEPVPDDQNAVKFYDDAAAALAIANEERQSLSPFPDEFLETLGRIRQVSQLVESNASSLAIARAARGKSAVDWGLRIRSPVTSLLLPRISTYRQLSTLLCIAGAYSFETGDNHEAIERLRDALALSDTLKRHPSAVGHFVSARMDQFIVLTAEYVLPNLQIGENHAPTNRMATPSQMRALVAELRNEKPLREGFTHAMFSQRMWLLDEVRLLQAGSSTLLQSGFGSNHPFMWIYRSGPLGVFGPLVELDGVFLLRHVSACAHAAREETLGDAIATLPLLADLGATGETIIHPLSNKYVTPVENFLEIHYRARSMRRVGAVALAIRLYEVNHGQRPATLADLVPDYLTDLPLDPLGNGENNLGYQPDADPPVLYCVDPNPADDTDVSGGYRSEGTVLFFLNGDRPHP
ncbi:MAG: hypothetical protein JSU63_20300 [Phycisphaerales bacterium]|nr:MAG: hypothetical protein JSU63_20300 [Phycisphaerales bacterium]